MKPVLLTLATICFSFGIAQAQSAAPPQPDAGSKSTGAKLELDDIKAEPAHPANTLKLKDAGPSSPDQAARMTAKNLAKPKNDAQHAGEKKDQDKRESAQPGSPDDAVVEFRPSHNESTSSSAQAVVAQDKQSKSPLKRVHGELYGAKSGIGHAEGGSVGGTSKSGKTSIYVQSDQAHATEPQQR